MIRPNKESNIGNLIVWLTSLKKKGDKALFKREEILENAWESIKNQYELRNTQLDLSLIDLIRQLSSQNNDDSGYFIGTTSMAGTLNIKNIRANEKYASRLPTKQQQIGVLQENDLTRFIERNQSKFITTIANHITIRKNRKEKGFSLSTDSGISSDLEKAILDVWTENYGKQDMTVQVIPSISSSGADKGNIDHTIQILLSYSSDNGFRTSVPLLSIPLQQKTTGINDPILSILGKVEAAELISADSMLRAITKYFKREDEIQFFIINEKIYPARQAWNLLMDTLINLAHSGDIDKIIRAFTKGKK